MSKIIAISKNLYTSIRKEHPKANIMLIGDTKSIETITFNEIRNKFLEQHISRFTSDILSFNKLNDWHHYHINSLNLKYLKVNSLSSLNRLRNKLKNEPVKLNLNTTLVQKLSDIVTEYTEFFHIEYFDELFDYSYNTIGKGELFLGTLTNLSAGATNDFVLGDTKIELKSYSGRLKGNQGYSNSQSVWTEYVNPYLINIGYNLTPLEFNFNFQNEHRIVSIFNDIMNNYGVIELKSFIKSMCEKLYIESKTIEFNFNNVIGNDTTFDYRQFLDEFLMYQFNYYKYMSSFDYFMLSNKSSYFLVKNEDEFRNNLKYFTYSGFSWKDDRSFVFSLKLK